MTEGYDDWELDESLDELFETFYQFENLDEKLAEVIQTTICKATEALNEEESDSDWETPCPEARLLKVSAFERMIANAHNDAANLRPFIKTNPLTGHPLASVHPLHNVALQHNFQYAKPRR
jgi:hypothetical protein